jgi:hypothetical protein
LSKEPYIKAILEHPEALKDGNQDLLMNLLERISTLEVLNDQLITSLRSCIRLLSPLKKTVSDPEELQGLLDNLEFALKASDAVQGDRIRNVVSPL